MAQLNEGFSKASMIMREYIIDGKKYAVTAHYVGDKDIDKVINEMAIERAYAEISAENSVKRLDKCV